MSDGAASFTIREIRVIRGKLLVFPFLLDAQGSLILFLLLPFLLQAQSSLIPFTE